MQHTVGAAERDQDRNLGASLDAVEHAIEFLSRLDGLVDHAAANPNGHRASIAGAGCTLKDLDHRHLACSPLAAVDGSGLRSGRTVVCVKLQLLYFDDCPNWLEAAAVLDQLAAEMPDLEVERRIVDTPDEAAHVAFHGSPSIHVDGRDLFASDTDPIGLSCRIYQTTDGPAGAPTLEQLRDAISEIAAGP